MLPKPELAYFAIADISGYTSFLAGVELDHAQDIIADFMDTVVKGLRPPFRLAKFEGDAAFVYAVAEKVDGCWDREKLSQQGLDTSTPSGRAIFQMLGVFAEFERAMIRERVM